ncbi:MAG TPA: hypothetical protein H9846_06670, partial [Candidatus Gemmiger excrementipullorum]|nr:hypothetical protein [Candidatus Gemmiger excrementipullorum]
MSPRYSLFCKILAQRGPLSLTKFYQNHTAAWFRRRKRPAIMGDAAGAQTVFPGPAAHAYKTDAKTRSGNQMKNLTKR